MRTLALLLALLLIPTPAHAERCACASPDGVCTTQSTDEGGCWAICVASASCRTGSEIRAPAGEGDPAEPAEAPPAEPRVSLSAHEVTGEELAGLVESSLDSTIFFSPAHPDRLHVVDIRDLPLSDFVAVLARFGVVTSLAPTSSSGTDAEADEPTGPRISLHLEKATTAHLVDILTPVLAPRGLIPHAGNPEEVLDLNVDEMPLDDLLDHLHENSTLYLEETP